MAESRRWNLFSGFKKTTNTKKNCWFCNEDCDVNLEVEKPGSWICPSCQQYNGFNEAGDYDHPIVEQHENSAERKRYCQKGSFYAGDSVLCHTCNQNQVLKVGQLASFIPLSESSFDEEVDTYGDYLDSVYRLCQQCQGKVNVRLTKQDKEILRKLHKENLAIKKDGRVDVTRDVRFLSEKMSSKYWGKLMFSLSLLMAVVNALVSVRHCLEVKNQRFDVSFLRRVYPYIQSLTSVLQLREMQYTVQVSIYVGTSCCVLGLLTIEKACIYGVDALHILLWLLLLIGNAMTSYGVHPIFVAPDIASLAYFILSLSITLVCIASLRRSRCPKHITQSNFEMSSSQHPVTTPKPAEKVPEKEESPTTQKNMPKSPSFNEVSSFSSSLSSSRSPSPFPTQVGEARNFFKPIPLSPRGSPSSFSSISPGIPQASEKPKSVFETVRHGLESFSLGLGKKSGSTSNVWSLPSVVTSEVPTGPDSTLPNTQQEFQRSILSPSRLSFVSFSRSPSPGKFSSSPSSEVDSGFVPDDNQQLNSKNMCKQVIGSNNSTNQSRPPYSAKETRPLSYSPSFHIIQPDKRSKELNGDDSDIITTKPNKLRSNLSSCQEKIVAVPDSSTPNDYTKTRVQNGLRRSNRIAMRGRIVKPWPLKKSLSENDMYDRCDDEKWTRKGKELMIDGSGQGKSGFHPFKHRQSEVLLKNNPDQQIYSSHWLSSDKNCSEGVRRRGFTRNMESIAESSDDDEMGDPWKSNNKMLLRGESSKAAESKWIWTLFGLVIGISVTVNVFLTWNLWRGTS